MFTIDLHDRMAVITPFRLNLANDGFHVISKTVGLTEFIFHTKVIYMVIYIFNASL